MFRYASFMRPLWIGFDPGTAYTVVDKQKSDEINGRMPHDVIETSERISPEHIYNLQLTSYEEIAVKAVLYEYAKSKFSEGRYLNCVMDLIHKKKITTTEKIDYYLQKMEKIYGLKK